MPPASRIVLPPVVVGFATGVAIVGIFLSWRGSKPRWVFVLALGVTLGALRYNLAQPRFDPTTLATYNDQQKSVMVEGVVGGEPDMRDAHTDLRVESDKLIIADQMGGLRAGFRRFQVSIRRGTIVTCNLTSDLRLE